MPFVSASHGQVQDAEEQGVAIVTAYSRSPMLSFCSTERLPSLPALWLEVESNNLVYVY